MATLRWFKASGATVASRPKLRWFKAAAAGAGASTPTLRWYKAAGSGSAAAALMPPAPQTLEPLTVATVTVTPAGGSSTPDSYVWRVVSGGPAVITGTGATVTLTTPAPRPPNPADTVIGVRGITGGASSPEVTCTLTVLPCVRWSYQSSTWVGVRAVALAGP